MDAHLFVSLVAAGSALVGLWLSIRLQPFAPASRKGVGLCFLLAWLVPGLARPLLAVALLYVPPGLAVLAAVFPVLVVAFTLMAWVLRYFAGLVGHAAR